MSNEQHSVQLVNTAGSFEQALFVLDEDDDAEDCRLILKFSGGEIAATAADFFDALCQVRIELETRGWQAICYGSSRHVYPSGMCRDMGMGLKAYRLQIGRPAKLADLVSIFAPGPDVDPVSVQEQRQFFEDWLKSLGISV
jgi:hypothetical protein